MKCLVLLAGFMSSVIFFGACADKGSPASPRDGAMREGGVRDAPPDDLSGDVRSEFVWPDLAWPNHEGSDWTWPSDVSSRDQSISRDIDCTGDPCNPGCPLDCIACPSRSGCCTKNADCTAKDKRYCGPKNTCVQCLDGNVCASTLYHWCYHNVCVQCLGNGYCPPQKPMCVNHRCTAP